MLKGHSGVLDSAEFLSKFYIGLSAISDSVNADIVMSLTTLML
jgi:hypothetical protein